MKELKITMEGYRPGGSEPAKRGVTISLPDDVDDMTWMSHFRAAIAALLKHERQCIEGLLDTKLDPKLFHVELRVPPSDDIEVES